MKISGDRTEQTKEGRKKRQMEQDVFEASESSDSDLEISEGLHRDFEKSSQWGKSLQMLKKMGWKEGEGLGRKQKGKVQIRIGPKRTEKSGPQSKQKSQI